MKALLHIHSYTAHPIRCAASVQSLHMYEEAFKKDDRVMTVRVYWNGKYAGGLGVFQNVNRETVLGTLLYVDVNSLTSGCAATVAN